MDKTALIFGATGQDGYYLSELLLNKGYDVVGVARRTSTDNKTRLATLRDHKNFKVVEGDILDPSSINGLISVFQPDEIYNLAAQSHVGTSFEQPSLTFQTNAVGVLNMLEGVRTIKPDARFYQASTSEMFGNNTSTQWREATMAQRYQDEKTQLAPRSPYAVAKTAAHNLVFTYRESYKLHASCGILFNHESEFRGEEFVTRKITKWIGEYLAWHDPVIGMGQIEAVCRVMDSQDNENRLYNSLHDEVGFPKLRLGNVDAQRDWGHAEDYVRAMWLMLQHKEPGDYVVATGKTYSIRAFLNTAFKRAGLGNWEDVVVIDPKFYRPAEVEYLCGNPEKARQILHWQPQVSFEQLVERMVDHDVLQAKEKSFQRAQSETLRPQVQGVEKISP